MKIRWVLGLLLLVPVVLADVAAPSFTDKVDVSRFTERLVLQPQRDAGNIARMAAKALERFHFSRSRFRDDVSARFFDRYLQVLDPQRMYFIQTDYDEFLPYRDKLDDLTMGYGDVRPAYHIFNRYLERIDQQFVLVTELLKGPELSFDGEDSYSLDRKKAERPADLAAAKRLWEKRLRFEYLGEKLNQVEMPTLASNVWKTLQAPEVVQEGDASTEAVAVDSRMEKLETLVGKDHAKTLLERFGDRSDARESAVTSYLVTEIPAKQREEILDTLYRRYARILRNVKQYESDEVLQIYIDSLAHAYDPHSNYFGKSELDSFSISMNLSLTGIGATLQSEDGYTVIRALVAGAPAERSKQLKVGDKIVAVAQGPEGDWTDVVDEKLRKVVDQIRGQKGSEVRLLVIPEGADPATRKEISLTRDEVKLEDSEAKAELVEYTHEDGRSVRVGVIDLPSFYASYPVGVGARTSFKKSTTGDVARLIQKLVAEKAEGIILDLRRNGGGSLDEAINLTGLFIKTGPVVQKKMFNGRVEEDRDDNPLVLYDGPLVVLTSRFSASASEIVAGALQDYGRALLVGDRTTHGKGTVQTIQELSMALPNSPANAGAIKVTVQKFYRASGASTQLEGVSPDIILPSINNHAEVGEASLENALPWDEIPSARFEPVNRLQPYLNDLRELSSARLSSSDDWMYVQEEIERFKKQLAEKSVSLNYDKRRQEKLENKNRLEIQKKRWAVGLKDEAVRYEISLKLVDELGLPEPAEANSVKVARRSARGGAQWSEGDDEDGEDTVSPPDLHLRETEKILLDWIRLARNKRGVAARAE